MTSLGVVFLTGVTTGGLSCLAVQGGLLASSVAHQVERDAQKDLAVKRAVTNVAPNALQKRSSKRKKAPTVSHVPVAIAVPPKPHLTWPVLFFLGSKLAAYTLLGLLLGWVGSVLQLSPYMRALLQVAIGVFMIGTALRMLNVHPIFRYFVIEPPTFLTRYIRRTAKNSTNTVITPVFLGALTVLIPCGVTQAMMALAMGAGTPLGGAAIMFAFTLGTSPVFFTLAYLATRLGERMQAGFARIVAAAMLILGLLSIDGGLNLAGSPLALASMFESLASAAPVQPDAAPVQAPVQAQAPGSTENGTVAAKPVAAANVVTINALDYGYEPSAVRAKAGQLVKLNVVTNDTYGCTRAFVIPALGIQEILPESGTRVFELPAQPAGTMRFTCSMGMYGGRIVFE